MVGGDKVESEDGVETICKLLRKECRCSATQPVDTNHYRTLFKSSAPLAKARKEVEGNQKAISIDPMQCMSALDMDGP